MNFDRSENTFRLKRINFICSRNKLLFKRFGLEEIEVINFICSPKKLRLQPLPVSFTPDRFRFPDFPVAFFQLYLFLLHRIDSVYIRITVTSLAPCAPTTNACSISAVFEGPEINTPKS